MRGDLRRAVVNVMAPVFISGGRRATETSRGMRSCSRSLGRLHHRLGMETLAHRAVANDIGDAQDHHALVMRHIGLDHDIGFVFGQARAGIVDRLVPAVDAERADARQPVQILARGDGRDHRRQAAGIRRDDGVLAESALDAEIGNAETGILIILLAIPRIVLRLRNAPGNSKTGGILDLAADRGPVAEAPAGFRLARA